jgi:hypothetical protein
MPWPGQPSGAAAIASCTSTVTAAPPNCPEPPVSSGWRRDHQGRWYPVDACAGHAGQLLRRPRPAGQVSP